MNSFKFTKCLGIPHWIPHSLLKYFSYHNTIQNKNIKLKNNYLNLYDLNNDVYTTTSCGIDGVFAQKDHNPKELEDLFCTIEKQYGSLIIKIDRILFNTTIESNNELISLLFDSPKNLSLILEYSLMNFLRNKKFYNNFKKYSLLFYDDEKIYNIYWKIVMKILKDKTVLNILIEKIKNFHIDDIYMLFGKNKILFLPDLPIMFFAKNMDLLNLINLEIKNQLNDITLKQFNFYLLPNLFILIQSHNQKPNNYDIANYCFVPAICCSDNYIIFPANINGNPIYHQEMIKMNEKRILQEFLFDFKKEDLYKYI